MGTRGTRSESATPAYLSGLIALFIVLSSPADEMRLEIIELQNRTVEDLAPILQPLVAPGGTITGQHDRLIVRTTSANLEEIKRVLDALDESPRSLRISVRQGLAGHSNVREDALSARLRAGDFSGRVADRDPGYGASIGYRNGENAVRYRTLSTRSGYDDQNMHFVQTVEGQPAFIYTGQSIPQPYQSRVWTPYGVMIDESIDYRDVESGFYVVPRLHGNRVSLEVAPQLERPSPEGRGAIDMQHTLTTVSGRLGEWIALGGVIEDTTQHENISLTHTRRHGRDLHDIWVKVDEIR